MWKRLIAGFGGAIALSVVDKFMKKRVPGAPDFEEVGEEVVDKSLEKVNLGIKDFSKVSSIASASDIVKNGLYYSFTPFKMNSIVGALGGLGTMILPKKLGLDNTPIAGDDKKKMMTVGYYVIGALVAGGIYKLLTRNQDKYSKYEN